MNIEKHISELLYRYQCVAVPGFGAFLTETVSAQLNNTTNSFYPPKKLIAFNANLKNNDGLLANQVALSEKITYQDAVYSINQQVIKWQNALETDNSVYIKNIGGLTLNAEKNIVFLPIDNFNYLSSSFGLSTLVSPDIKRTAESAKITTSDFESETTNNLELIEFEYLPKPKNYSNLKYAAVFLIGCGLTSPVFLNLYKEKIAIENLTVVANVQKQVDKKIQEATFFIPNPLENIVVHSNAMNYHVVAGAFKIEANADKICKKLISNGFAAKKINQNINGLFPVIYSSYNNYADARNAMQVIQKTNNPDAWVLIQELEK